MDDPLILSFLPIGWGKAHLFYLLGTCCEKTYMFDRISYLIWFKPDIILQKFVLYYS